MVGLGLLMMLTSILAVLQRIRGKLFRSRTLLWIFVWMSPAGFIALLSGWVVTEIGRQPWTIYGLLRTANSVSPIPLPWVITSCCGVVIVYVLAFSFGMRYLLRYINSPLPHGPEVVVTVIPTSP